MISYPKKFGRDESNNLCDAHLNIDIFQKKCRYSLEAFFTQNGLDKKDAIFTMVPLNVTYYMASSEGR